MSARWSLRWSWAAPLCALLGCDIVSGLSDFEVSGSGGAGGEAGSGGTGGEGPRACPDRVEWSVGWTGTNIQAARAVVELPDERLLVLGYAYGDIALDATPSVAVGLDIWTARLSAAGEPSGGVLVPGMGDEFAMNMIRYGDGALIPGRFTVDITLGTTLAVNGPSDAFLGVVGADGVPTQGSSFSLPGDQVANDVAIDAAGITYLTGNFMGNDLQGTATTDGWNAFIVALNATNGVAWQVVLNGADDAVIAGQEATAIAVDGAGSLYATGRFGGQLTTAGFAATASVGSSDIWVAKLTTAGAVQWIRTFGSLAADVGQALVAGPDGVVVVGQYGAAITIDGLQVSPGGAQGNGFALGLNPDGEVRFFRSFRSGGDGGAYGIATDPEGALLVTGTYSEWLQAGELGGDTFGGPHEAFVARLSDEGEVECLFTFGSSGDDFAWRPTPSGDGVIIAGEHGTALSLGDSALPDEDSQGALVFRLAPAF